MRPGHYVPAHRPLAEIEVQARRHGIGHLVLVQPSVYGTDNTVMLRALEAAPGRHRAASPVAARFLCGTTDFPAGSVVVFVVGGARDVWVGQ